MWHTTTATTNTNTASTLPFEIAMNNAAPTIPPVHPLHSSTMPTGGRFKCMLFLQHTISDIIYWTPIIFQCIQSVYDLILFVFITEVFWTYFFHANHITGWPSTMWSLWYRQLISKVKTWTIAHFIFLVQEFGVTRRMCQNNITSLYIMHFPLCFTSLILLSQMCLLFDHSVSQKILFIHLKFLGTVL